MSTKYANVGHHSEIRAREVLERIIGIQNPVGAEIGIFVAQMSVELLNRRSDLFLYMVDSWKGVEEQEEHYKNSDDYHAKLSADVQEGYFQQSRSITKFANDRRMILRMDSVEAAKQIQDKSLDFVFIDCDHSYLGCKMDIEAWAPKVKPGGILSGHDYENDHKPRFGVTQAVNEWVQANGLPLELGENFCWFVRIPDAA